MHIDLCVLPNLYVLLKNGICDCACVVYLFYSFYKEG